MHLLKIFVTVLYRRDRMLLYEAGMITQTPIQQTTPSAIEVETTQRVIVLVPDAEIDLAYAAKKIWEIATSVEGSIRLIGLCADSHREPGLYRQLVTLSALMENGKIPVHSSIEFGSNWQTVLRTEWQQGDIIVCFSGVSAGFSRKPLSQILESTTQSTVHVIDGLTPPAHSSPSERVSNTFAWIGSIVIVVGLFWLQTIITHLPSDWERTLLLSISVFAGFGMIWVWNSLFG
jgi:hypothetical protein